MNPDDPPGDPLRLTRCMRCGYSLAHLPPEGNCPECGLAYDQSIVVFYGEGRHAGELLDPTMSNAGIALYAIFVAFQCGAGWVHIRQGGWSAAIYRFPWLLGLMAMLVWRHLARRESGGHLLQCRFNAFGCLQCPLPGEMIGLSNPMRMLPWLLGFPLGLGLVIGLMEMPWRAAVAVAIGASIAGVIGWRAWRASRRRRPLPPVPEGARALMADVNELSWRVKPTPWLSISGLSIQPIAKRPGRYRLIFQDRKTNPIDAEVDCTGEQATALWNRVRGWRAAVGRPFAVQTCDGSPVRST